jgi:ketosteroid isomerase-like protein
VASFTRDPSSAGMIYFDCPRCGFSVSGATTAPARDAIVRWADAFNGRDFEGMLARFHPDVRFHPRGPVGLDGSYRGHDGAKRWFVRRTQLRHELVFALSDVHCAGDDQVLAVGALTLAGEFEIAAFCGLHRIVDGRIVAAHHDLTDADMLERLGLVR